MPAAGDKKLAASAIFPGNPFHVWALMAFIGASSLVRADPAPGLSPDVLGRLYRGELGDSYHSADLPRLQAAGELLEQYFSAISEPARKKAVAALEATGLDCSMVGRLARLRMGWTELKPGVYYVNDKIGPRDVRYFIGIPAGYDMSRSWPLVVMLPDANAFLTDPMPDGDRVAQIYSQWIEAELAKHPDAILLMPLLNLTELYGPGPVGMNLVMQPILHAAGKANIDPSQVYLVGHSMAAHAVWNLAIHYPTYFAAINPMAGSAHDTWQRFRLGNLQNILCVVWHDTADDVVKVDESREIVRYLRLLQYDVDYTETKGLGHSPPPRIVEDEYRTMRGRQRNLYPQQVFMQSNSTETIYNRADWVQIYQPMTPGRQIRIEFSRGKQGMYLYQNGFRAAAQITDPHTITMQTRNVRLVRVYLNDQMVDLSEPVKVVVNGTVRFEAMVPQSMEEMLKDQLFLGRGWRYYTAVIDLDLSESPATAPSTRPTSHAPIEYVTPEGEHKVFIPRN